VLTTSPATAILVAWHDQPELILERLKICCWGLHTA
jgi:hypothetical protein